MEQLQERPAGQMDRAGAGTRQTNEQKAQTDHSARKRKEWPTEEEHMYTQSRYMESTQTTLEVQASWETYSHSTPVSQASWPIMESKWIQHQGQPRNRILVVAHGKSSTGDSSYILDEGRWQPLRRRYRPQHHSEIHRGESRVMKGIIKYRVWNSSKERAAELVASGSRSRFTTLPRMGWQSFHWSGVIKFICLRRECS
jgi:hypothetical protein